MDILAYHDPVHKPGCASVGAHIERVIDDRWGPPQSQLGRDADRFLREMATDEAYGAHLRAVLDETMERQSDD